MRPRARSFLLALILLAGACRERGRAREEAPSPAPEGRLDLDALARGEARALLGALAMPHHYLAARLGAHRLRGNSELSTRVANQTREVRQELDLRVNAKGHYSALKHTHPQHGQEVIWTGEHLYPRLRHGKFVKRAARAGEPAAILDRMAGLLPAYTALLRRFLRVELKGTTRVAGRTALKVELGLDPSPRPPASTAAPARAWRQTISVSALSGIALLDRETGAPLSVDLRARWSFNPPKGGPTASGIPGSIDRDTTGTMELSFQQRVSEIGAVKAIAPPPEADTIDNPRRVRLELERQMLTGELPLPEDGRAPERAP